MISRWPVRRDSLTQWFFFAGFLRIWRPLSFAGAIVVLLVGGCWFGRISAWGERSSFAAGGLRSFLFGLDMGRGRRLASWTFGVHGFGKAAEIMAWALLASLLPDADIWAVAFLALPLEILSWDWSEKSRWTILRRVQCASLVRCFREFQQACIALAEGMRVPAAYDRVDDGGVRSSAKLLGVWSCILCGVDPQPSEEISHPMASKLFGSWASW